MAKLNELLKPSNPEKIIGGRDVKIKGIAYDSRRVEPGFLFVAIKGFNLDGHKFINAAISRGAVAVVMDDHHYFAQDFPGVTRIKVKNSREALGLISAQFYNNPSNRLNLIGVTGTNGKTTTTYLIESILNCAGLKCGLIGSLGHHIDKSFIATTHTTPESLKLQELLHKIEEVSASDVIVEVSSHALALDRVKGCHFNITVFTNITQDHLDFHKTFNNYLATKKKLFTCYSNNSRHIINSNDHFSRYMVEGATGEIITYGFNNQAQIKATNFKTTLKGTTFDVHTPLGSSTFHLNLVGNFSIYNALAATGVALAKGIDLVTIEGGLRKVNSLPGRFEIVDEGQDFTVVVDYAHTPDGLEKAINVANEMAVGRTIVVFGCGGDRDKNKRPIMGDIATSYAQLAIITSDNPRSEEPGQIVVEIAAGIEKRSNYLIEPDRYKAIQQAINLAKPGDLVLIAGKGHETHQIFKDKTIHFDDREVAREILRSRR